MTVPVVRRIVVGVDGSEDSAAALRWACREASIRGAEVHAVHAWEAPCHTAASYAAPSEAVAPAADLLWSPLLGDDIPRVQVRMEVAEGLAARVLLDRCAGADMLVLGSSTDLPGALRAAGPVIRICLRRAPCPVVVISGTHEQAGRDRVPDPAAAPSTALVPAGSRLPVQMSTPAAPAPAGARA
jgi:nucleotide-binding universal stress UspA family protein